MGLEDTELLIRIDDMFGLQLDDDYEDVRSVGDVYHRVRTLLSGRTLRGCPAPHTYFQIRKKIIDITGALKSELRLKAPLRGVLSIRQRKRLWNNLERHSELRLPPLETAIPEWIIMAFAIATGIPLAVYLGFGVLDLGMKLTVCSTVLGVFMIPAIIAGPLQGALRFAFPKSCDDIGELLTQTVERTYDLAGEIVWRNLRDAVAEIYGVPPEEVTPDLLFADLY